MMARSSPADERVRMCRGNTVLTPALRSGAVLVARQAEDRAAVLLTGARFTRAGYANPSGVPTVVRARR